ncbi:hypothetical protein K470DRAFT_278359 [Piedraia hortae CBS 480.64]|uniref:Elongator complex protein 5 n=1 Tax=Piedraia hortae CBS 480.64 TaxID=1314780 RepID=A0A6A7BV66_9PEZI|nr:hypothetical protein K470DRAFT_278359 [Piedraia hortae CBS 480.64]
MPPHKTHAHTHKLLLMNKLLSDPSPFTLILDTLEQSSRPLIKEILRRANERKMRVIFVSFEILTPPSGGNITPIHAWKEPHTWHTQTKDQLTKHSSQKTLLIIDSLHQIHDPVRTLTPFLYPNTSLIGVYHTDIPTPSVPYHPDGLTMLKFLATTIFSVRNFRSVMAFHEARGRRVVPSSFGIEEGEGVLLSRGANGMEYVLEVESRRKSGREVVEVFWMGRGGEVEVLDKILGVRGKEEEKEEVKEDGLTFELGLKEKEKREREGVVLPYYDAQATMGEGRGGRILYDFGVEDDFDEEEDEI